MSEFGQLAAKIRNVFSLGIFQKRYDDGKIQVKTFANRILEKKESFPYGFIAKAKKGKVLVFCQGGNFDGFEIMPLLADDDIKTPELDEEDVAVYTDNNGNIKIYASDRGKIFIGNKEKNLCKLMLDFIKEVKEAKTTGSPTNHTISPDTQIKLDQIVEAFKSLLLESA